MITTNLSRYAPEDWDNDIIGNSKIKLHFKQQAIALRTQELSEGTNTLVYGEFGTGKSSTIRFFVRCLLCEELDINTVKPMCGGKCSACRDDAARYGEQGLTRHSLTSAFNYMPIDCMTIKDSNELIEKVRYMQDFDGIRIVHLEEISRLVHRGLDEVLLGPLTDLNYMWIASGATLTDLDPAFLDRFPAKLKTSLPSLEGTSGWVVRLCYRNSIRFEAEAVLRLAELSNCICRKALKPLIVLSALPVSSRKLTLEFVESFTF